MKNEKKRATTVTISLPDFHLRKLDALRAKLGIGRSGMIQRLIENQSLFSLCQDDEKN